MKYLLISIIIGIVATFNVVKAQTNPNEPNILVIIADDVGIDVIEGFQEGGVKAKTPNINSLREKGVSFTNAWSNPKCTPTRAAMMSGKHGVKTGVTQTPGDLETVHTSVFREVESRTNGSYADAVIGKWHLTGRNNTDHPSQHGVDHYEGSFSAMVDDYYNWEKVTNGTTSTVTEYATTHITTSAINWINNQSQPWFLWMSHMAPHSPFHVPPSDLYTTSTSVGDRFTNYVTMIEAMDAEIGRLLSNIPADVLNNTFIIFLGDNGTPNGVLQNYPNRHGKSSLYQGGVAVPMVVAGAGVTRQNEVENNMVNAVDIYATVLEVLGEDLPGGIYNSLSFEHLLDNTSGPARLYNYTELGNDWTIRNEQYKLIQFSSGTQEFYDLIADPFETNNLVNSLSAQQQTIKAALETEGSQIRTDWSCNDFILNGDETTIDDCTNSSGGETTDTGGDNTNPPSECDNDNSTSTTNIGCCDTPNYPSAYYETVENDERSIYSNNYPNHGFCYNVNNIPAPKYYQFEIDATPQKAASISSVIEDNGRPKRHFGMALNGIIMAPAPATPFIFENTQTGEYNWDWVFEPTNNQGNGRDLVALDCASAHTGPQGYHYHGNMFEYVEQIQPTISTITTPPAQPLHIGWASDGFPILYRFGPDGNGTMKLLQPSYQLISGERPGDGISAPCGSYNGKYTNDYEYVANAGDLDACNGIDASITIGQQTFTYFYVITDAFPQIPRCLSGTPSSSFDNNSNGTSYTDNDNDGYISIIDCDDNDASIHPNSQEIDNNNIDENCDGMDSTANTEVDADNDGFNSAEDCDDNNANINPSAMEIPNNGIDEDCDGTAQVIDADNDGFNSDEDCDDNNANINPSATDIVDNGIDENCDGMDEKTTSMVTCATPTQLTATPINSSRSIQISWGSVNNAQQYIIQIRFKGRDRWIIDANIYNTTVIVRGPASSYEFRVKTICNDGEESEFSSIQEFTLTRNIIGTTSRNSPSPSIPELIIPLEELTIFPNPVGQLLYLEQSLPQGTELTIYASSGEVVIQRTIKRVNGNNTINVQHLDDGIYFLFVQERDENPVTLKFIKE